MRQNKTLSLLQPYCPFSDVVKIQALKSLAMFFTLLIDFILQQYHTILLKSSSYELKQNSINEGQLMELPNLAR